MDIYKRFNEFTKLATDTYLEATEVFYPPHFDGTPNIGDADESKIGAIATYKTGSTTNLAIYQGGGVWREGTGYTDAEIDAMIQQLRTGQTIPVLRLSILLRDLKLLWMERFLPAKREHQTVSLRWILILKYLCRRFLTH